MGLERALPELPRLRRYARLLTGSRERADDLVQDTLERACRKWSLWREADPTLDGSGLRRWLLTMMHNVHLNHLRDERLPLVQDDGDVEAAASSLDMAAAVGARLDMAQALAALSSPLRDVVLLVCVEECSYEEAARILDVPVGTVMSRLSRGRERLRALLSADSSNLPAAPALRVISSRRGAHER
ncbi:MAG: RNA polymerase sigma factor [Burkholderiales bacterium]|nr:RNA polymerase sigma factor [Burkholderiales bacterium]